MITKFCFSGTTDFIHASYVRGGPLLNTFILTQAPMQSTQYDFWRMVCFLSSVGPMFFSGLSREKPFDRDALWCRWPICARPIGQFSTRWSLCLLLARQRGFYLLFWRLDCEKHPSRRCERSALHHHPSCKLKVIIWYVGAFRSSARKEGNIFCWNTGSSIGSSWGMSTGLLGSSECKFLLYFQALLPPLPHWKTTFCVVNFLISSDLRRTNLISPYSQHDLLQFYHCEAPFIPDLK